MNSDSSSEYYVKNTSLNCHIDNIVSYKNFLDNILKEIKQKNYNKNMIKLISKHIEKSLSEISNDTTLFQYSDGEEDSELTPSVKIVSIDSDTSDSESDVSDYDSEDAVDGVSDEEDQKKKLQFYKTKMELYQNKHSGKLTHHSVYGDNIYNDEPDFLDDGISVSNPYQYQAQNKYPYQSLGSKSYSYQSPNSSANSYSYLRQNSSPTSYQRNEHMDYGIGKSVHFSHGTKPYMNHTGFKLDGDKEANKDPIEQRLDMYSSLYSGLLNNDKHETEKSSSVSNTSPGASTSSETNTNKPPEDVPKSKDKLANDFINNNLQLNKYHYLKSFNTDRINNYCNSVSTY